MGNEDHPDYICKFINAQGQIKGFQSVYVVPYTYIKTKQSKHGGAE